MIYYKYNTLRKQRLTCNIWTFILVWSVVQMYCVVIVVVGGVFIPSGTLSQIVVFVWDLQCSFFAPIYGVPRTR